MSYNKRLTTFLNRHRYAWWCDGELWAVIGFFAFAIGLICFFGRLHHGC